MIRLRFFFTTLVFAFLLSGCGNRDAGKNDELMPAPETKPDREPPKKDADTKHTHEPG